MTFSHLHVHSTASPLDGLVRADGLHAAMRADGQPVVAITDHGDLGGLWGMSESFAKLNARHGTDLRVAPGIEAYAAIGSRFDPGRLEVPRELDNDGDGDSAGAVKVKTYQHLTLHAYNPDGYRNLLRIFRAAQDSFYKHPLIDFDLLAEHSEGLNVGSGCLGGVVAEHIKIGDLATAETNLGRLRDIFGADHVFVEVMDHGLAVERRVVVPELARLARKFGLPLVATNDAHYTDAGDAEAHEVMLAVGTHGRYGAESTFRFSGSGYHIRTEAEMRAVSSVDWWQAAVSNTAIFADMVEPDIVRSTVGSDLKLPAYVAADGADAHTDFIRRAKAGALARYGQPGDRFSDLPADVQQRIKTEHQVIHDFGVESYMLIEADACDTIRAAGIPTGAGRGSAAGSAAAYALDVTMVEPLSSKLLFERFLNLSRKGLPDVDTDVPSSRQVEAMQLIADKFGHDRVVRVGRRTVKQAKAALKAVGTALGSTLGYDLAELAPAKVPDGAQVTLSALLDEPNLPPGTPPEVLLEAQVTFEAGAALRALRDSDPQAARIIRFARAIEGNPMSWATHAGGLVVADRPVHETAPVWLDRKGGGFPVMQADMTEAEAMGFVKYDFLPIADLDVVSRTVELVEQTTGEQLDLNALHPDDTDERAVAAKRMVAEGRTAGVFQLASRGLTELVMSARPDCLDDFSALLALYRPGPMGGGMHTAFAERRRGGQLVDYDLYGCTDAEAAVFAPILGSTLGLTVYQEQMMLLAQAVAGFDGAQMGKLQKAISKKIAADIADLHAVWLEGGLNGRGTSGVVFSRACLESTWRVFEASGKYAFNASHSTAYAFLTWWTAWLKANFPTEFSAALLQFTEREEKRIEVIRDMQADGTTFLPPDVNLAAVHTSIVTAGDGPSVMLGLSEVKGVKSAADLIVEARSTGGPFVSVADFKRRTGVNATVYKNLVDAGGLDRFGPRLGLASVLLVAESDDVSVPPVEWGALERDFRQRRVLGVSLGEHPLRTLRGQVREWVAGRPIVPPELVPGEDKVSANVLGLVVDVEEKPIRTGTMLVFTLESSRGTVACKLWPDYWSRISVSIGGIAGLLGRVVLVSGRTSVFTPVRDDDDDETPAQPVVSVSGIELQIVGLNDPGTLLPHVEGRVQCDHDLGEATWLDDPSIDQSCPVEAATFSHDVKIGEPFGLAARVSTAVLATVFGSAQVASAAEWLAGARPGDQFTLAAGADSVQLFAVTDRRVRTDLRKAPVMARLASRRAAG